MKAEETLALSPDVNAPRNGRLGSSERVFQHNAGESSVVFGLSGLSGAKQLRVICRINVKLDMEEDTGKSCGELDGKQLRIDEPFEVQDVWWERGSCWCWELRDM